MFSCKIRYLDLGFNKRVCGALVQVGSFILWSRLIPFHKCLDTLNIHFDYCVNHETSHIILTESRSLNN